jgi:hypothetical protein
LSAFIATSVDHEEGGFFGAEEGAAKDDEGYVDVEEAAT